MEKIKVLAKVRGNIKGLLKSAEVKFKVHKYPQGMCSVLNMGEERLNNSLQDVVDVLRNDVCGTGVY